MWGQGVATGTPGLWVFWWSGFLSPAHLSSLQALVASGSDCSGLTSSQPGLQRTQPYIPTAAAQTLESQVTGPSWGSWWYWFQNDLRKKGQGHAPERRGPKQKQTTGPLDAPLILLEKKSPNEKARSGTWLWKRQIHDGTPWGRLEEDTLYHLRPGTSALASLAPSEGRLSVQFMVFFGACRGDRLNPFLQAHQQALFVRTSLF